MSEDKEALLVARVFELSKALEGVTGIAMAMVEDEAAFLMLPTVQKALELVKQIKKEGAKC